MVFVFKDKKDHARAGFEYILGTRKYKLKNGSIKSTQMCYECEI